LAGVVCIREMQENIFVISGVARRSDERAATLPKITGKFLNAFSVF